MLTLALLLNQIKNSKQMYMLCCIPNLYTYLLSIALAFGITNYLCVCSVYQALHFNILMKIVSQDYRLWILVHPTSKPYCGKFTKTVLSPRMTNVPCQKKIFNFFSQKSKTLYYSKSLRPHPKMEIKSLIILDVWIFLIILSQRAS